MSSAFFEPLSAGLPQVVSGALVERFTALGSTAGPWSPTHQHGGPPGALLVRAAERLAAGLGRPELCAVRVAAEFLGPVPVGEVQVSSRTVRSGRATLLVDAELRAGDVPRMAARLWLAHPGRPDAALAPRDPRPRTPPGPDAADWVTVRFPYRDHIEWRVVADRAGTEARTTVWVRPRVPLIAGETTSGLQRTVLCGDSASGVSAPLDWARWSFPNIDLDVHLARQPVGPWLCMDAETVLGGAGTALARCSYADVRGSYGASLQTLLVQPVRSAPAGAPQ